ncbi:MAG: helix-turn-helix transcriptional regulator [Candidatus Eisenbacteria bacterium]|uniref:Helix-turn-helix transcriptional regulator n=1 Tax=Eiseniibacteriota bacterium TaxID=2212470 RepID=A0A7Y2H3C9_UNCEI|nr:helix-turn-helix transcriptional regulator [Candidatus Eisenbacteria bacterium]
MDLKEKLEALDAVVNALAHPARRQILLTVHFRGGSMRAGDIAGRFAHAWPTTTRHIRALEQAGLLRSEKRGRSRTYHLQKDTLDLLKEWLRWFDQEPWSKSNLNPEGEMNANVETNPQ